MELSSSSFSIAKAVEKTRALMRNEASSAFFIKFIPIDDVEVRDVFFYLGIEKFCYQENFNKNIFLSLGDCMSRYLPPGDPGFFYGYASVFDTKDDQGDLIKKGAFFKTLLKWQQKQDMPKLLWSHDWGSPIGKIHRIYEDEYGLFVQAQLALDVQKAKEARALVDSGAIKGLSVGFKAKSVKSDKLKQCRVIEDVELYEVSLVALPANSGAVVMATSPNPFLSSLDFF